MERCAARDGLDQQCMIHGPHEEIINSKGQRALVHHTKTSIWNVAVMDLQIATAFTPDPEMLGRLLDRARHATPADVAAGGSNNEEELLTLLRLGFMRGTEGDDPGVNNLGFVAWHNGNLAFMAGWNYAKSLQVQDIISQARSGT